MQTLLSILKIVDLLKIVPAYTVMYRPIYRVLLTFKFLLTYGSFSAIAMIVRVYSFTWHLALQPSPVARLRTAPTRLARGVGSDPEGGVQRDERHRMSHLNWQLSNAGFALLAGRHSFGGAFSAV